MWRPRTRSHGLETAPQTSSSFIRALEHPRPLHGPLCARGPPQVVAVPPLARHADLSIDYDANKALCAHLAAGSAPAPLPAARRHKCQVGMLHCASDPPCARAGGCNTWLYGGNANFYNIRVSEFREAMTCIADIAAEVGSKDTCAPRPHPTHPPTHPSPWLHSATTQLLNRPTGWLRSIVIPSVGPDYGKMVRTHRSCTAAATCSTFSAPGLRFVCGEMLQMDEAEILKEMDFPTAMVLPLNFPGTAAGAVAGIRSFAKSFGKKVIVYIKSEVRGPPSAALRLLWELGSKRPSD